MHRNASRLVYGEDLRILVENAKRALDHSILSNLIRMRVEQGGEPALRRRTFDFQRQDVFDTWDEKESVEDLV